MSHSQHINTPTVLNLNRIYFKIYITSLSSAEVALGVCGA